MEKNAINKIKGHIVKLNITSSSYVMVEHYDYKSYFVVSILVILYYVVTRQWCDISSISEYKKVT